MATVFAGPVLAAPNLVPAMLFTGTGQWATAPVAAQSISAPLSAKWQDLGTLCLSAALYHEARGESAEGQRAVAQVILNRVRSRAYPGSICGVVYQNAHQHNRCQFSFACDTLSDFPAERATFSRIQTLSTAVLSKARHGFPATDWSMAMATHYHATHVSPSWSRKIVLLDTVGRHIFYRSDRVVRRM